ncbi:MULTISPECIES: TetR/AcrR family transcriptional regulator [unclassified Sphingomonas]|uniref:TetR/AcrR family transcriptional regulator n=1 Tax=unclassified Sphingomonas TaxID=196159 RepID=UPI000AB5CA49|nr:MULTISPECIES: TetR/AcrR family transcriptional regulator [unclassified Sphingomonas]
MGRIRTIERDKLLDAAEAVTMEKGPTGLTIAAVAERMGITNGGVQYSFRSKESLIAAMFERWQQEYAEYMIELGAVPEDEASRVRAHIAYGANYEDRSKRGAPTLLVSLLNSPQHMTQVRRWYRNRIDAIDLSTDEGRWLRLAFVAMEGAFLMRLFGLIDMKSDEWHSIVADIWALVDGKLPQADRESGRQAA